LRFSLRYIWRGLSSGILHQVDNVAASPPFRETCCLHFQGWRVSQGRKKHKAVRRLYVRSTCFYKSLRNNVAYLLRGRMREQRNTHCLAPASLPRSNTGVIGKNRMHATVGTTVVSGVFYVVLAEAT
jgi:hypothetical protein